MKSTTSRARLWVAAAALAFYLLFILRTSFSIGGTRYFVLFEDAMISMQKANISFQTTVQVRNKLVAAYNDIMNMPL